MFLDRTTFEKSSHVTLHQFERMCTAQSENTPLQQCNIDGVSMPPKRDNRVLSYEAAAHERCLKT